MLERVKDFRYEEIKNWKPLVSLRESYQKENALKNGLLVAVIFLAILVGFAVVSGGVRFTNPPETARPTQDSGAEAITATGATTATSAGGTRDTATPLTQIQNSPPINPVSQATLVENRSSVSDNSPQLLQSNVRSGSMVGGSKIAVCNLRVILQENLSQQIRVWETQSNLELQKDKDAVARQLEFLSENEISLLEKLFDQKKEIARFQIQEKIRQYRESAEESLQPIVKQIAINEGFGMVILTDKVLAYDLDSDITRFVLEEIQRYQQNTERLGRNQGSSGVRSAQFTY